LKRKLTGILTKFVILALALYAGISLVRLIGRIDGALAAKRELDASHTYDHIVINNIVTEAAQDLMRIMDRSHGI